MRTTRPDRNTGDAERPPVTHPLAVSSEISSLAAPASTGIERRGAGARLRVLHVIDRLATGGTEYGILKVMDGLGDESFEQRLCATRGFDPAVARQQNLDGKLVVAVPYKPGFQLLVFRLARIMREYRPHIVHSRNWGAIEAIPAARLARVPVVIHSEHGYEVEMLGGLPRRRRLLRRAAFAMADAVFTVTGELRSYHAQQAGVSLERVRVIPNGVDTRRFSPRPEIRLETRQRLGLPTESFVVGTVARMVPIKDHPTLLKAAAALAARGVNLRILMVGAGPELARQQEWVKASPELAGRVVFLGACDAVADVLNAMDVFVLPSLSEGMSNTLLEAMASGLPVVATRVGGNPELIEDARSGLLFSPGEAGELANRLERLAGDAQLRRQLGAAARCRAVAQFSLERMLADYRNLYVELASRRGVLAGSAV